MPDEISLSAPDLTKKERTEVLDVLNTSRLALGPRIQSFENEFAEYIETDHAVAVSSGTAALQILLERLLYPQSNKFRYRGPEPEVITTPFSFVATTTTILHAGAKPVFVDIEPDTYNLDPDQLVQARTGRTAGILPAHIFGLPASMDPIHEFADEHELFVIEDACEAIGATYRGRNAGTMSDAATFAFYPNKQMTTGEGGMIVTNREEVAQAARSLRNQGRKVGEGGLRHIRPGHNFRMTEMQAALGRAQLERLPELRDKRRLVAHQYIDRLEEVPGVDPLPEVDNRTRSWFVFPVRLAEEINRKRLRDDLDENGIQTALYFPCIHRQPFFEELPVSAQGPFPVAEHASEHLLSLPFHTHLTEKNINRVIDELKNALSNT